VMTEDTYRLYQMTAVPLAKFLIDVLNKQQFQDTGYQLQVREEEMDIFQEDEQARAAALTQTVTALASPETFLIAAAIQGYDLSEEVQTQIQALITKKEADRQQIQAQLNQAPTQPTDQQPPAQDAPNKAMMDDLARLRRKALKNIGKEFCFESPNIPNLAELLAQLKACTTENEIKAIFDIDITPPPEYGNPDYSALLEAMRLEIVGIKSNNQPGNIIIDTTGRSVESTILSNQNIGLDITKSIHSMSERMEKSIEAMIPIINIPAPVVNVTVEPTPIKVTNDVKIPKQEPPKVEVKATPVIHNKPTKSHEKQKIVRDAKGVMIGTESETTFEYKE
jgi:hypothetical protein